jgi:hypothetical protein
MDTYYIHLKGGSVIKTEAERIEFPGTQSETLQIYISESETDKDKIILTSEVAAVIHEPPAIGGGLAMGSVANPPLS